LLLSAATAPAAQKRDFLVQFVIVSIPKSNSFLQMISTIEDQPCYGYFVESQSIATAVALHQT
jgi:hypothetical protein